MSSYDEVFPFLDLAGTYAFATSGALAASEKRLDVFGVGVIAYAVACGGGVIRDLCIGAIPPAGLSDWRYVTVALTAATIALLADRLTHRFRQLVLVFDGLGLAFFAVSGAQKTVMLGHGALPAVLLGTMTAIGGGVIRDVCLGRVPVILQQDIYASAALAGATLEIAGRRLGWAATWRPWLALAVCFGLRLVALHRRWNLPRLRHG